MPERVFIKVCKVGFVMKNNDSWLVNFPQCGKNEDIATLGIKETDLKEIQTLNALINEQIKAQFEE